MTITTVWSGTATALSSIAHGGETRGTITLLRRELIAQPNGDLQPVPVISGNSLRGRLRRVGEELLRDTLGYEGHLTLSAAHALRGGGALAKTSGEPLSGARLHNVRELLPHLGVFGAAAGGRIIDGALQVGKLIPYVAETNRITGAAATRSAFEATQIEDYTRQDDAGTHHFPAVPGDDSSGPQQMLYRIETFPAGTMFAAWIRLDRATDLEHSYFSDVLHAFTSAGTVGGRAATGHGQISLDLHATSTSSPHSIDWRDYLHDRRAEVLNALQMLT